MSIPSNASPGPGWWQASDGQWYPQKWQTLSLYNTNENLKTLIDETDVLANQYGQQGWEVVSSSIERTQVAFHTTGKGSQRWTFQYSIVYTLKRPVPPG